MTNACKYGSLCQEGGHFDLTWSTAVNGDEEGLLVYWREKNGPRVVAPTRRCFGSKPVD